MKRRSQAFEVTGQGVSLEGQELGVSGPPPCWVLKAGLLQRPQGTPSCAPLSMECPPTEPNISYIRSPPSSELIWLSSQRSSPAPRCTSLDPVPWRITPQNRGCQWLGI